MDWNVSIIKDSLHALHCVKMDVSEERTASIFMDGSLDHVDAEVVGKKGVCWLYIQHSHITDTLHFFLPNPISIHTIQIVTQEDPPKRPSTTWHINSKEDPQPV
jgi:hypothetical protein